MPPPLDETSLLESVENPNKGDRLNLENFGEGALVDALVVRQIGHRLVLRAREAEMFGALIEAPAEQPSDIIDQEAKRGLQKWHRSIPN